MNVLGEIKILIRLYDKLNDESAFLKKVANLVDDGIITEKACGLMMEMIDVELNKKNKKSTVSVHVNQDQCRGTVGTRTITISPSDGCSGDGCSGDGCSGGGNSRGHCFGTRTITISPSDGCSGDGCSGDGCSGGGNSRGHC